ncbi:MAG TPA: hypothetical protein VHG93_10125 [Longimicrobium sp.]|nr:hypothetical protein [Longimicrobium sp.]
MSDSDLHRQLSAAHAEALRVGDSPLAADQLANRLPGIVRAVDQSALGEDARTRIRDALATAERVLRRDDDGREAARHIQRRRSFPTPPELRAEVRWSRCPRCEKLTHYRKFPLLIHIDGVGLLTLGKTCRYCTPCEFIIANQSELEEQLVITCEERGFPEQVGNPYTVFATVERAW